MSKTKTTVSAHGVHALTTSHAEVRKLKRQSDTPSIHGNKVWRSSFVLMDYFLEEPIPKNKKVMDIGCGWGLTGVFMAKEFGAKVLATDADDAVEPYVQLHNDINNTRIKFEKKTFQQTTGADFKGYHTVVGGDICFWDELVKPLYNLTNRALKAGVKQVIIADPGRPPFWELADMCNDKKGWTADAYSRSITDPIKTTKHLLVVTAD